MTTQPEALRLAQELDAYHTMACHKQAAAELRRLHGLDFALRDCELALQKMATKYMDAVDQRDSLLEACRAMLTFIERHAPRGLQPEPGSPVAMARAAIKSVEGENHAKNF